MSRIIPRDLIKHLEWIPGNQPPIPRNPLLPPGGGTGSSSQGQGMIQLRMEFEKYIQVGIQGIHGNPVVISPFEIDGYNNMNYDNTHKKILESGLPIYMPTPRIFTAHFKNILSAKAGDRKLLYANSAEVEDDLVDEMYKHVTRNHKDVYNSGNAGTWTWLNARFVQGTGFNGLNLETITGLKTGKNFEVESIPLEECLWEDCWSDISFNSQGLVTSGSKSATQKKVHGKTMYFWYPRNNAVARFDAYSVRACLNCYGDPSYTDSGLGVFACAEGTASQKTGGST